MTIVKVTIYSVAEILEIKLPPFQYVRFIAHDISKAFDVFSRDVFIFSWS